MINYFSPLAQGLVLVASIGAIAAIYFTWKLHEETKGDEYWTFFLVSALAFGICFWIDIPVELHLIDQSYGILIANISSIVGFVSIAYASQGIYFTMKRIRTKTQ